jgi:hypothetical protein
MTSIGVRGASGAVVGYAHTIIDTNKLTNKS